MSEQDLDDEDVVAPIKKARPIITDAEFDSARDKYELGTKGLIELADEIGVTRQGLSRRFKAAGVVKNSRIHSSTPAPVAVPAAVVSERFSERRAEMIEETRTEGMQALKQAQQIAKKIMIDQFKKIASGTSPGAAIGDVDDDMKTAVRFNKVLIENIEARLRLLNADDHIDDGDLPTLTIEDLTNEEVLQHHKNTGAFDEEMTVEEMLAEEIEIGGI